MRGTAKATGSTETSSAGAGAAAAPVPADGSAGPVYSIGRLAEEFRITPRSIRFYEEQGLLSPQRVGTARVYSYRDRARLILICRGKRLGFSLAEIKEFLGLYDADPMSGRARVAQMSYLLERTRDRIADLRRKRQDVEKTLDELGAMARQLEDHLRRHDVDSDQDLKREQQESPVKADSTACRSPE